MEGIWRNGNDSNGEKVIEYANLYSLSILELSIMGEMPYMQEPHGWLLLIQHLNPGTLKVARWVYDHDLHMEVVGSKLHYHSRIIGEFTRLFSVPGGISLPIAQIKKKKKPPQS